MAAVVVSTCVFSGSSPHYPHSRDSTDLGVLVISFIFLIGFASIFVVWFIGIKSGRSVGKFPVLAFTVALAAALMYCFPPIAPHHGHPALILTHRNYTLQIAGLFALHCAPDAAAASDGLSVGSFIANTIQDLINVGIVLAYIVPLATGLSWPFIVAHRIVLAIISAICLPFIVVNSLTNLGRYIADPVISIPSPHVVMKLAAAYYFLLLCIATYCVCILIFYRFRRRTDENPRQVS